VTDAAEAYGPHEVERILGEGIAFRDKVAIISKFGWNIDPAASRLPSRTTSPRSPSLSPLKFELYGC
jgi:aryl-alcohol dehydrogenase-like predicted oxidoreductase